MRAVNLIPGEQRQGAGSLTGRSSGGALIVLAVVAGLAVLVLMYGSASHKIASQKGQAPSLTAQANAIQARTGRLAPYTSFVSMADQRTQTVAQLVQARFDWSHALHELGRVMPAGTSLATLHGSGRTGGSNGLLQHDRNTGARVALPRRVRLPGAFPSSRSRAVRSSQSVVAQTLQRLKLMDGASEVQLQSSTQTASGSSSSSSGSGDAAIPSFSAQVAFQGLPSGPAPASAAVLHRRPPRTAVDPASRSPRQGSRWRDDYPRSADADGNRRARRVVGVWFTTVAPERERAAKVDAEVRGRTPTGRNRRIASRQRDQRTRTSTRPPTPRW